VVDDESDEPLLVVPDAPGSGPMVRRRLTAPGAGFGGDLAANRANWDTGIPGP
jgi:hypothetical protein